jgi:hypothetical protein
LSDVVISPSSRGQITVRPFHYSRGSKVLHASFSLQPFRKSANFRRNISTWRRVLFKVIILLNSNRMMISKTYQVSHPNTMRLKVWVWRSPKFHLNFSSWGWQYATKIARHGVTEWEEQDRVTGVWLAALENRLSLNRLLHGPTPT